MENSKQFLFYAAFFVLITSTACWIPRIINGRPKGGKLGAPKAPVGVKLPPSQWFELQRQDHFDQGLSIERVKNLYHMLKTLVGQCRIYLHTKSTFKIHD